MKTPLYSIGTRVRIRRGSFPVDPRMLGRTGLVVRIEPYEPDKIGVILDGEQSEREFSELELERMDPERMDPERVDPERMDPERVDPVRRSRDGQAPASAPA